MPFPEIKEGLAIYLYVKKVIWNVKGSFKKKRKWHLTFFQVMIKFISNASDGQNIFRT